MLLLSELLRLEIHFLGSFGKRFLKTGICFYYYARVQRGESVKLPRVLKFKVESIFSKVYLERLSDILVD